MLLYMIKLFVYPTYLNFEDYWRDFGVWLRYVWQEGGGAYTHFLCPSPHDGRFEDVATPTIHTKQPLVQVHGNVWREWKDLLHHCHCCHGDYNTS